MANVVKVKLNPVFLQVVCSQVHCGPAIEALHHAVHGERTGPIWMDNVQCTGNEEFLEECDFFAGWGKHNCRHSEDVILRCTGKQLVEVYTSILVA